MRKMVWAMLWALLSAGYASAQSKVFNQIAGAIRTDFGEITQNRKAIGYVRLVQLDKASKTTYNYELTIMDENLNDISTVKFSDGYLSMNDVAFEGDVLCATFSKSAYGDPYANNVSSELYFISLEGKILKTQSLEGKQTVAGVIRNIPGLGFIYQKKGKDYSLNAFDLTGKKLWSKPLEREMYNMAATPKMISYQDAKQKLLCLVDAAAGKNFFSKSLGTDKKYTTAFLNVQVYDDTVYYSGITTLYDSYGRYVDLRKGAEAGVMTVKAWGTDNKSIKVNEVKWDEGQSSTLTKSGANPDNKKENYHFTSSATTRDGNTYLYAENILHKARVGKIIASVLTAVFIVPPIMLATTGYNKYSNTDVTVFRLSPSGQLTKFTTIEQKPYGKYYGIYPMASQPIRSIVDAEGENAYFISGNQENRSIVNIKTKKVKYIPISSGDITASIFPAKEGHYVLVESNKKTKSTKLSIVPL